VIAFRAAIPQVAPLPDKGKIAPMVNSSSGDEKEREGKQKTPITIRMSTLFQKSLPNPFMINLLIFK
jgi:hypothetical protein